MVWFRSCLWVSCFFDKSAPDGEERSFFIGEAAFLQAAVGFVGAAHVYGEIRATLEKAGTPIGAMDMPIAAHAVSLGIPLVTNNTREFVRITSINVIDGIE